MSERRENKRSGRAMLATCTAVAMALIVVVVLVGGFHQHRDKAEPTATPAAQSKLPNGAPRPTITAPPCPQAADGHGTMGGCAPNPPNGLQLRALSSLPHFDDLSNNNPIYDMAPLKRNGSRGVIVKVNQGSYYADRTAPGMLRAAKAAHLYRGGYDFMDPRGNAAAEAQMFVRLVKSYGVCRGRGVFPPTADVEYGNITRGEVATWVSIVKKACGRAQVYTGQWYWNPHIGCYWPGAYVAGWVSAYTSGTRPYPPCGIGRHYRMHQYTDRGFNGVRAADRSVFYGSTNQLKYYVRAKHAKPKPLPRCIHYRGTKYCRKK